jgi:hypothetical protein
MDVVGKRKCSAAIKDYKREILDEFFFGNERLFYIDGAFLWTTIVQVQTS